MACHGTGSAAVGLLSLDVPPPPPPGCFELLPRRVWSPSSAV